MRLESQIFRIAEFVFTAENYQYFYDPKHKNKPRGQFWPTEKGWSNDPKHSPSKTKQTQNGYPRLSIPSQSKSWSPNFPKSLVMTSIVSLLKDQDYKAAKAGKPREAIRLAKRLVKSEKARELLERCGKDCILLPIHADEASGKNKLPLALATQMATMTGMKLSTSVVQSVRAHRTGSDAMYRMLNRPKFVSKKGYSIKGKKFIICDDVSTQGGTISEMKQFIESRGGFIVDSVSFGASFNRSTGVNSSQIAPTSKTLNDLVSKWGGARNLQSFLKENNLYDGNFQAMTESEAKYLLLFSPENAVKSFKKSREST